MADLIELLKAFYRKKKELAALEKARSDSYSAAGQAIAAKQAELTLAEQALMELA